MNKRQREKAVKKFKAQQELYCILKHAVFAVEFLRMEQISRKMNEYINGISV